MFFYEIIFLLLKREENGRYSIVDSQKKSDVCSSCSQAFFFAVIDKKETGLQTIDGYFFNCLDCLYHMFLFGMILWFVIFSKLLMHQFACFFFQTRPDETTYSAMTASRAGMTAHNTD